MPFSEDFPPLTPVNFFQIAADCKHLPGGETFPLLNKNNYKKYLLPDTSALCGENPFAEVALGWNQEGIEGYVRIDETFTQAFYPAVERGDSVEVFIDTRDVKTATFNTRFCHHFFFFAEGVEGKFGGEITHFRTEDVHPLCDPKDLKVKSHCQAGTYAINFFIPSHCLVGYDPAQFKRMGFSYRINRSQGLPQHFSVVTDDYQIDQQPSLWASIKLVK
jgi:hypothetical protein